jgi:hypothetical protein
VNAYRARSAKANSALVVVIDSDTEPIQRRQRQLRDALAKIDLPERASGEAIVHLIPKRNIETWVLFLNGRKVDEETDNKGEPKVDELIVDAARTFHDLIRANPPMASEPIPSLSAAMPEARRLG